MDVVNFAHGELVMLGAFTAATTLATTGNFWLALVVATLVIAVFGALLQVTTLRPLLGSGSRTPQEVALTTILATFGISLVLQKYALWQWGPSARKLQEPITGQFTLFYLQYPWYRIATALLSAAIIGALYLFLKYGKYGIWIRAAIQDRVMAQAENYTVNAITVAPAAGASASVEVSASAGVPLYQSAQALEQLSRTEKDRKKNAKEIRSREEDQDDVLSAGF